MSAEPRMLSRIAESLYWLGRYTERAEATARILDVYSHALLEDRVGGEESACRRLVEAMGATEPAALVEVGPNVESLVGFFVDDPRFEGSVVRSLEAMWENARGAREAMSSEMWASINATHSALDVRARPVGLRAARLPRLGPRPGRDRLGARRRDDESRRHVALHRARPFARTRRPHRAPAVDPARRRVGECGLGRDAAVLRGVRVVPAHLPAGRRGLEGARVPAARPPVPAFGVPRARRGGDRAVRSRPHVRSPRRRAASRGASSGARAPISSSSGSPSSSVRCPSTSPGSNERARTRTTSSRSGSSTARSPSGGARDGLATVDRTRHQLRVRRGGARVVQRSAYEPGPRRDADGARPSRRRAPERSGHALRRLLGYRSERVRRARAARPAHRRGAVAGRNRRSRSRRHRHRLGGPVR